MTNNPLFRGALGPYAKHPPVEAFCTLSAECFALFHEAIGGQERSGETGRQHLTIRMMYISETTSSAVRLNASWALSIPAMSLVRDRYEQVVRHSWLMHQPDSAELIKYVGFYYAKMSRVFGKLDEATKKELLSGHPGGEAWMTTKPTKEERKYLERWESLDLESMAKKRDQLLTDEVPFRSARQLSDLYTSIYRQFSSASHFDMYSMNMLALHRSAEGKFVLAPDPWWPAMLCLHTALFDLIQCAEVCKLVYGIERGNEWDRLFERWREFCNRIEVGSPANSDTGEKQSS
jgi:hypothetical protein